MKSKRKSLAWKPNSWNEFLPWPTKDVLDREEVAPTNIGVLVERVPEHEIRRFAPALLCEDDCVPHVENYQLMLRPGKRIVEIQYVISKASGEKVLTRILPIAETLDPTPIPVTLTATDLPLGELIIVLAPRERNRIQFGPPIEFSFYNN